MGKKVRFKMRKLFMVFMILSYPFMGHAAEGSAPKKLFFSSLDDSKEFIGQECLRLWSKFDEESRGSFSQLIDNHIENHPDAFKTGSFHKLVKTSLYDYGIGFHNQGFVAGIQISNYLEQQIDEACNDERNCASRRDHLEYLKKNIGGVCNGLAVLWMYGKWLEDDSFFSNSAVKKDDIIFFNKVWRELALWDGVSRFTTLQKNDIERFIANMIFYQHFYRSMFENDAGVLQEDLSQFLEDTKRGAPHKVFVGTVVGDREILVSRLKLLIKPKTMILVSSNRHAMAMYQNSQTASIYFYDSNDEGGEKKIESFDQLADELFTAINRLSTAAQKSKAPCANWIPSFEFAIYQFEGDPVYEYPTEQELKITVDEFRQLAENDCFLGDHERVFNAYKERILKGNLFAGALPKDDPLETVVSMEEYAEAFTAAVMRALEGDFLSQEEKDDLVEKVLIRDFHRYVEGYLKEFILKNYPEVVKRSITRKFK